MAPTDRGEEGAVLNIRTFEFRACFEFRVSHFEFPLARQTAQKVPYARQPPALPGVLRVGTLVCKFEPPAEPGADGHMKVAMGGWDKIWNVPLAPTPSQTAGFGGEWFKRAAVALT